MPIFRRNVDDDDVVDTRDEMAAGRVVHEPVTTERVEVVDRRWNPGTILAALAGAALAVIGIVAAIRTELDETWYSPVEDVLGINHTPLLAVIEIGVGAVLVVLGLAGARALTALVCIAVAIAAAVVAIDPDQFQEELAMERWWAITLAASAGALTLLSLLPWPATVERYERGVTHRGRAIPQH